MDYGLLRASYFWVLLTFPCILLTVVYGQFLSKPDETVKGVLGGRVQLECAEFSSLLYFIWNFVKLNTSLSLPIASSFGGSSNVHAIAARLGDVSLINSTLVIKNLQTSAEGTYVCQVPYEEEGVQPIYIDLVILVPVSKPLLRINNSAAVEGSPVMLTCLVKNGTGPIEYIWHRNTIQDGTVPVADANGSVVSLSSVNRTHIGWYTCTGKNEVNQETSDKVYLDVIYGPDDPVINIQPFAISETGFAANEQEEVIMTCLASSNPPCQYIWFYNNSQIYSGQMYVISKISRSQTGTYTCLAQNSHLNTRTQLTISLTVYYLPDGAPTCTALARNNYKDVALWCSWTGGLPPARLRWLKSSEAESDIESFSNVTRLKRGAEIRNGSTYTCVISHPGLRGDAVCRTTKYGVKQEAHWSNLTIRDTEWNVDGGNYQCLAINAVGNTTVTVNLQVMKHPTPPNVTISKLMYSKQRTEVDVEWMTKGSGNLTGFIVQRQVSKRSAGKVPENDAKINNWDIVINDIEPEIRGHKLGGMDPSIVYAFRILAVNHRTTGFPSEVKTPADPPFNAYPAVIGAGVGGMLVAVVAMLLVFQYIVRNRENNPRLHDLFFRPAPAEAREHISSPEDAETAADIEDSENNAGPGAPSPAPAPPTASGSEATGEGPASDGSPKLTSAAAAISQLSAAVPPDDSPVNVTITVTASP
ncbi:V-set and immunoglobulin domain-containing protein 10-like 2 [Pleurodeles waltl]|uniref:V-set and immunoglobulin domain-containing protein 10-like 2 n=1 Tax=Pleurodeles waltl TaxID=8319 RepID=UPI003709882D